METIRTDCLVIGAGLAGSAYAHHACSQGLSVTMICADQLSTGANSKWAQGGIIYDTSYHPDQLEKDIMVASANTANPEAVRCLVREGQAAVQDLLLDRLDIPFDRSESGDLQFTREGGHSDKRIIYAKDVTGRAILNNFHDYVRGIQNLTILENHVAIDLLTLSHNSVHSIDKYKPITCIGVYAFDTLSGEVKAIIAKKTILATGGLGQVFKNTTNQPGVVGHGVAMASRVGARIIDLEYIQFHPTVFLKKNCQLFLVSEAVRGEGGVLVNGDGHAFMDAQHPMKSLAPRDIVARAIHRELIASGENCVYIDLSSMKPEFIRDRFPSIYERALACGVDISREPIPVAPAAHYTCGGVYTDLNGRSSVRNLNAIGETACTGLHGANRLASTSLLECLVSAKLTAKADLEDLKRDDFHLPEVKEWVSPERAADEVLIQQDMRLIKSTMWNYVGLIRSPRRLQRARRILGQLDEEISSFYAGARLTRSLVELRNAVKAALLVVHAASLNPESKGSHYIAAEEEEIDVPLESFDEGK
ncbi:L-aspartate oxidase [Pelagicoccus sp. SDUM812005]|uniref:L-aspartate oxidase n=1 Tax=Pelagicoccus sp. SDUM812005 TaxID=3041257 RepID=UPI00280E96B2|nr:L-aspartate oxidase [Pelagicoccus sp. SDUM812005]MDQ8183006.1 L-aspartate oxidase [Pelagicoccus sp. SDUM812005]